MEKNDCIKISIAKDFSLYPGARYRTDGDNSGQQFYEDILKPKFNKVWKDSKKTLLIDFDGTFGYASSFISEIFNSLVKDFKNKKVILKKVIIKSEDDPFLIQAVKHIINENKTT